MEDVRPRTSDGGPSDGERFDAAVASLDPAMAVITALAGDRREGCLVGFHGQSSIEPRRYGLWVSKANATFDAVTTADHVGVHLLTAGERELARLFGTLSGDEVDKFARCPTETGPHGVPLLADCRHRFVGRRVALLDDGGDHVLLTVEPSHVESPGRFTPLRLSAVADLEPGHDPGRA